MTSLSDLLGNSAGMRSVREKITRLLERPDARRLPPVLIQGETGTGKGLLARMIHRAGPRPDGPFVDVNCPAIPETLLEAEMFGFERGAFTDARRSKPGLFQAAHRGTIFLDEVGLLPEAMQAKLLKALEDRTVRRLGATRDEPVDVWIVTATNEDLRVAIRERRFREDLYHRLAVLTVALPPLRERGNDITMLAEHFLGRVCADYGVAPKMLSDDACASLRAYAWPGNVRELSNVIERAVLQSGDDVITASHLGLAAAGPQPGPRAEAVSLDDAMRGHLVEVLNQTGWNISRTAALLDISRNTLRARMDRYGLRERESGPKARARPAGTSTGSAPAHAATMASAAPPAAISPGRRWERRRVALLRAALVPATTPDAPIETARILDALIERVRIFGGRVEGLSPIGLVALFGAESAGDAADRAAYAGLAIVKALERARRNQASEVGVKVGIHVTSVLVGLSADGADMDMEARRDFWPLLDELVERAPIGCALVTGDTAAVLKRRFELGAGAGHVAWGPTHTLVGRERTGLGLGGRVGALVGRRQEIERLQSHLGLALGGQGQVVGLVGDAGIGKSRLIFEFRQSLIGGDIGYLEGHCHVYGVEMPYLPIVELLYAAAGLDEGDVPEQVRAKLEFLIADLGMDVTMTAPYLLRLVGVKPGTEAIADLQPDALKLRLLEAFRQLVLRLAQRRALVIVVDDLQWCDAASMECLRLLADHAVSVPLMFVATYRSGYLPPWLERAHASQIALRPLAPPDSRRLVHALVGEQLGEALQMRILGKAEGNPLFLEELCRALREHADDPLAAIPDTIHDVLMARIDRLPHTDRAFIQATSVIGKDVSLDLLHAVVGGPLATVAAAISRGVAADLLVETEDGEIRFRHALAYEVALRTVPVERRRALDAKVVEALEAAHAGHLDQHVDRLGHHAFRGELWERSARYLSQAGAQAASRCAHREAAAVFARAMLALKRLPETTETLQRSIDVRFQLRTSLTSLAEYGQLGAVLREAESIAQSIGDRRRLGRVSAYVSDYCRLMGDPDQAITAARRALDMARVESDVELEVLANAYLGLALYTKADYHQAIEFFRANIARVRGELEPQLLGMAQLPAVHSRAWLAACLAELGEFDEAEQCAREASVIAETAAHTLSCAVAQFAVGHTALRHGRPEVAVPVLERSFARMREWSSGLWLPTVGAALGRAYVGVGRVDDAVTVLEEAVAQEARMKRVGSHAARLVALGEAYLAAGRVDEARAAAGRAHDLASSHGEHGYEADAARLLGRLPP